MLPDKYYVRYDDLDNDGSSEEIIAFVQENTTALTIGRKDGILDQWNFKGTFDFWFKRCLFIAGDKENDGKKEVYVFTLDEDTILLHCIPDFTKPGLSVNDRVIAIAGQGRKAPDPFIVPAEMDDLDGDGIKELIFGVGSGFSKYPRNVFAYYISKDSLVESPESSFFISSILQADVNNDGKKEIVPHGYATSNVSPENAKYHDYSSFLMVLDQNLKFLFEPIELKGRYSQLTAFICNRNGKPGVGWLFYQIPDKRKPTIYFAGRSGTITDSIPLDFYAAHPIPAPDWDDGKGLTTVLLKNGMGALNSDFKLIKSFPELRSSARNLLDIDTDGKKELLVSDIDKGRILIYREGFKHLVSAKYSPSLGEENISLCTDKKSAPLISIQSGKTRYLFQYGLNPAWPFYYLYLPLAYLAILSIILFIKNIQTRKKYEIEKKMSELQLALIRNQLDPHFTFNVINSIIYSIEFSENKQAGEQLRQFSNMYRDMLLSARSTRRTIGEELDFCTNYLQLEKTRFGERFNYNILVSPDVDRNYLIPKFLIQIHAENAVKHGLSSVASGGKLIIEISNEKNNVLINITDNGIGRVKSAEHERFSTGKGMETMEELYSIYNKYYNEKISSQIIDLYHADGNPAGTRVLIRIRKQTKVSGVAYSFW